LLLLLMLLLLLLWLMLKLVLAAAGKCQAGLRGLIAASKDHTSTACAALSLSAPLALWLLPDMLMLPASAAPPVVGESQPSRLLLLGLLLALAMTAPPLTRGSTSVNFTSSHTSL
jgi:hypothetical protein